MAKTYEFNPNLSQDERMLLMFANEDGSYNLAGDKLTLTTGYVVSIPWKLSVMEAQDIIRDGGVFVLGRWLYGNDTVYCDLSVLLPYTSSPLFARCQEAGEKAYWDCVKGHEVYFPV